MHISIKCDLNFGADNLIKVDYNLTRCLFDVLDFVESLKIKPVNMAYLFW